MNRVIVAGTRTCSSFTLVRQAIEMSKFKIDELVSGEARGVDTMAETYAKNRNIPIKLFPADWDGLGKAAGFIRNEQMAKYATHLIAIWNSISPGTQNMIELAKAHGLKYYIYIYD